MFVIIFPTTRFKSLTLLHKHFKIALRFLITSTTNQSPLDYYCINY